MLKFRSLFTALFVFSPTLAFAQLDPNGILIDAQGKVQILTFDEAQTACPSGTHLPSIREVASDSLAGGAKILELSEVKPGEIPYGFLIVEVVNADGTADKFYYNEKDFIPRTAEVWKVQFWSSSSFDEKDTQAGAAWYGTSADIFYYFKPGPAAVRCFAD